MKKFKFSCWIILLGIALLAKCEIYISYLNSFQQNYTYFEVYDIDRNNDFLRDIAAACEENDSYVFVKRLISGKKDNYVYIYTTDTERFSEDVRIKAGEYKSIIGDTTNVYIKKLDEIDQSIYGEKVYINGTAGEKVYNSIYDKYQVTFLKKTKHEFTELTYIILWIVIMGTMITITVFECKLSKREKYVRVSLGDSISRIILVDLMYDYSFYVITAVVGTIISKTDHFTRLNQIFICGIIFLMLLNSIPYILVVPRGYNSSMKKTEDNIILQSDCEIMRMVVLTITILLIARLFSSYISINDFLKAKEIEEQWGERVKLEIVNKSATVSEGWDYDLYVNSLFYEKYDDFKPALACASVEGDSDYAFLNVNEAANVILKDIFAETSVSDDYDFHILVPSSAADRIDEEVAKAIDYSGLVFGNIIEFEVIIYSGNVNVLYYSNDAEYEIATANRPIITYYSGDGQRFKSENIDELSIGSDFNNLLFEVDTTSLENWANEIGLSNENGIVLQYKEKDSYLINRNNEIKKIVINLTLCGLAVWLLCFLRNIELKLYFLSNALEIAIKKIMGHSFVKRYQTILIATIISSLVATVVATLFGLFTRLMNVSSVVVTGIIVCICDYIQFICKLKHMGNYSVIKAIKGSTF